MNEYNEGDKLTFERGTSRIEGVVALGGIMASIEGLSYSGHKWMVEQGWTVVAVEKAAPALPTEPGIYADKNGLAWELMASGNVYRMGSERVTNALLPTCAPLTRLEPVADTAKKVLDFIGSSWEFGAPSNVLSALKDAAKEFGVIYE